MASLNHCTFIGNLGASPELRFTPGGDAVCNFRMAVSHTYTKDGEKKEDTEWLTIVSWGKLAEMCNQYLDKGRKVYVAGRLRTRKWEGKDGNKGTSVEIVADKVLFLDRAPAAQTSESKPESQVEEEIPSEELPF